MGLRTVVACTGLLALLEETEKEDLPESRAVKKLGSWEPKHHRQVCEACRELSWMRLWGVTRIFENKNSINNEHMKGCPKNLTL